MKILFFYHEVNVLNYGCSLVAYTLQPLILLEIVASAAPIMASETLKPDQQICLFIWNLC